MVNSQSFNDELLHLLWRPAEAPHHEHPAEQDRPYRMLNTQPSKEDRNC